MDQISWPGLGSDTETGMFERAYRVDPDTVARVRFVPAHVANELDANIPLQPRQIGVMISASLVNADGQVLTIGGRGLIGAQRFHGWSLDGAEGPDVLEAWLEAKAVEEIERVVAEVPVWTAAGGLGLIAPPAVEAEG